MIKKTELSTDIAIVGAGPVGLFCAFQAGMLGMSSIIIDTLDHIGGQCIALYPEKPIFDIPAYPQISAKELIDKLDEQAKPFKPLYLLDQIVESLSQEQDETWILKTSHNHYVKCKALIIAAGCGAFGPNRPPLDHIMDFEGKSIFYSVTNRSLYKNKKVVIAGGGDSALDWALSLSEIAQKIYIIHRRDNFRAMEETVRKTKEIAASGIIEFVIPYQLNKISGHDGMLTAVEVIDLNGGLKTLEADYLLPFFGLKVDLGPIAHWGLNLDKTHITVNPATMMTNINSIFAVGDIASFPGKLKLILTGFAEAALACHNAYKIVFPNKVLHFQYSTNKGLPK